MKPSCGHGTLVADGTCPACNARFAQLQGRLEQCPEVKNSGDTKPTNPKDRAATTRLDLSLFPATARAYGALAMAEGHLKYGGYNYRDAGVLASIYYAAAGRHLDKWFNGQERDSKTGVPHLANALACIAVLIDAVECNKLNDDRPPRCDMDRLLAWAEERVAQLQELFPNGPARYTHVQSVAEEKPKRHESGEWIHDF